jgi:AraC-like DNA-binding protein
MNEQQIDTGACAETGGASRCWKKLPTTLPDFLSAGDPLLQRKYRDLMRGHFSKVLGQLFTDLTGVCFRIRWIPLSPRKWDSHALFADRSVCRLLEGSRIPTGCRNCGLRRLAQTLSANKDGRVFSCHQGVRNFWIPIRIQGSILGIACVQALDARSAPRKWADCGPADYPASTNLRVLSRLEFSRAARLLRLIVQHAQSSCLAGLHKADLLISEHALTTLAREQERLLRLTKSPVASPIQSARSSRAQSRGEQIVHRLVEHIHQNYCKPITLRQCSDTLHMNTAYLSTLFSHAVGVPFKLYLTEFRLSRAKEMLGDPSHHLSEVASRVGYSSENRFRLAFKKATGLSPKLWRETMQPLPQAPSA